MRQTIMLPSNPDHEDHGPRVAGTVGRPLPGVNVRIVDDQDNPVAEGAVGHVQVQGPNVFSGYWQMPEKTAEERSEEHTSELQSRGHLVCRLLLEKKKQKH